MVLVYGRGKTLFFVWLALAYTLQGYNVMHFTLEDPQEDVEDRFDAAKTSLPHDQAGGCSYTVAETIQRYKRMLRTKLKVVDGTDQSITISGLKISGSRKEIISFTADVVITDYDDEIRPEENN